MSLRRCVDSVNASELPRGYPLALAYVDGAVSEPHGNPRLVRARMGNKCRIATVTVLGNLNAHICDCEKGDLTPADAAKWAHDKRKARKGFPTIYCIDSQRFAVIHECGKLGLRLGRDYELFVANYDNVATVPSYAVAKQYADSTLTHGDYDISVARPYWRGVDPRWYRLKAPLRRNLTRDLAPAKKLPLAQRKSLFAFLISIIKKLLGL